MCNAVAALQNSFKKRCKTAVKWLAAAVSNFGVFAASCNYTSAAERLLKCCKSAAIQLYSYFEALLWFYTGQHAPKLLLSVCTKSCTWHVCKIFKMPLKPNQALYEQLLLLQFIVISCHDTLMSAILHKAWMIAHEWLNPNQAPNKQLIHYSPQLSWILHSTGKTDIGMLSFSP